MPDMRIASRWLIPAACLLICCFAPLALAQADQVPAAWAGRYVFDGAAGHTVGGSPITYHYELTVRHAAHTPTALLHLEGYQQDETIIGNVTGNRQAIDIRFASYSKGSMANAYGVQRYKPGQILFRLSHTGGPPAKLLTTWLALHPEGFNQKGVYFRRNEE